MSYSKVTVWKADMAEFSYGAFDTEDDAIDYIRNLIPDNSWRTNDVRIFPVTIIEEDEE